MRKIFLDLRTVVSLFSGRTHLRLRVEEFTLDGYHWIRVIHTIPPCPVRAFLTETTHLEPSVWSRSLVPVVVDTQSTHQMRERRYTTLPHNGDTRRRGFGWWGRVNAPFIVCLGLTPTETFYGLVRRSSTGPVVFFCSTLWECRVFSHSSVL